MSATITWVIQQLDRQTSDGFVTTAHWTATTVDGDYTASVYNTCRFASATPSIPYASVTEQDVLDWCWANGVDKDAVEASLESQIELLKNPVTATGVPW
jgi:hypothetical protein